MKKILLNILLFIFIFAGTIFFDYQEKNTFNWIENLIQTSFLVIGILFFEWMFTDKKSKKNTSNLD